MASERFELQARLKDELSGPLKKIKDQITGLRATPGMQAATDQIKRLGDETKKFVGGGGALSSTLDAIGVGGLATAGSLAAVVVQMRALGENSLRMKELARETGVSANFLNAWSMAGSNFGVSSEAMQAAVDSLSAKMVEFRKHQGELFNFTTQNAANFPGLTNALEGETIEQQFKTIMQYADRIKNPQLQKSFLSEFFGNPDDIEKLFARGAKGFFAEFDKIQKSLNPINPDLLKQAQVFRESLTGFNIALANFENSSGPLFLKQMTSLVHEAQAVVDTLNNPFDPKNWLKAGKDILRNSLLGDIDRLEDKAANALADKLKGSNDNAAPVPPPPVRGNLFHKSSYNGDGNGLLHLTAYSNSETTSQLRESLGLAGIIADGTKSGVLAAFREMMATNDTPNSAGGFMQASYETGGGAGGFGGDGGSAGGLGGSGGRGYRVFPGYSDDNPAAAAGRRIGRLDGSNSGADYHDPNAFYDAIISAEGTGKHGNAYDTSLGYTKSPVPLTSMTLAQSLEWGDYIRKHTRIGEATNSSAKGAFQIVNTTERLAIKALGLHMNELFSEENQRKMASWIARHQGLGAWASMPTHPRQFQQALRGLRAGEDLQTRRATGLASTDTAAHKAAKAEAAHVKAEIHIKGAGVERAHIKARGAIEASLHRWPVIGEFA